MHNDSSAALRIFNQTIFSLSNLDGVKHDPSGLAYKRLKAYEGESLNNLQKADRESFVSDFCQVFGVDKAELLSFPMSPSTAISRISRLRAGQPDHELFFSLAPMSEKLTQHLTHEISARNGSVKFIIGDRGMGKTTLAQLIENKVSCCNQPIAHFTSGLSNTLSANSLFHSMFMTPITIQYVIQAIRALSSEERLSVQAVFERSEYFPVFKSIIFYAVEAKDEAIPDLAAEFSLVTSLWMVAKPSKRLAIKNFLKPVLGQNPPPVAPDNLSLPTFAKAWLAFIHAANVYPITIVDEFEAYLGLFPQQRLKLLDYLRMIADLLWTPDSAGLCLFLTTRDGFNIIRNDPALYSRFGSNSNSMLSGQWRMERLNEWDTDHAKRLFNQLYQCAAQSEDAIYKDALKISQELDGFELVIDHILENKQSPRSKIRDIIEAYDSCADDVEFIESKIKKLKSLNNKLEQASNTENSSIHIDHPIHSTLFNETQNQYAPSNPRRYPEKMEKEEIDNIQYTLEQLLKSMKKHDLSSDVHDDNWTNLLPSSTEDMDDVFSDFSDSEKAINKVEDKEDLLKRIKAISTEQNDGMIARLVPIFFKKDRNESATWPKELLIDEKPLLMLTTKYNSITEHNLNELIYPETSYSKIAALYSSYRDSGGVDYFFAQKPYANLVTMPYCTPESALFSNLNNLLLCAYELKGLPVGMSREMKKDGLMLNENPDHDDAKHDKEKNSLKRVNVDIMSSLSMMRRFAYTYVIGNGHFIEDRLIDEMILNVTKILIDDIYPSRQGVFFYLDGKLESISTYIE